MSDLASAVQSVGSAGGLPANFQSVLSQNPVAAYNLMTKNNPALLQQLVASGISPSTINSYGSGGGSNYHPNSMLPGLGMGKGGVSKDYGVVLGQGGIPEGQSQQQHMQNLMTWRNQVQMAAYRGDSARYQQLLSNAPSGAQVIDMRNSGAGGPSPTGSYAASSLASKGPIDKILQRNGPTTASGAIPMGGGTQQKVPVGGITPGAPPLPGQNPGTIPGGPTSVGPQPGAAGGPPLLAGSPLGGPKFSPPVPAGTPALGQPGAEPLMQAYQKYLQGGGADLPLFHYQPGSPAMPSFNASAMMQAQNQYNGYGGPIKPYGGMPGSNTQLVPGTAGLNATLAQSGLQ